MRSRRWLVSTIALLAVLLLAGRILSGWYVDYQWYAAHGGARLWLVRAIDFAILRGTAFVLATAFAFANLLAVRHSVRSLRLPRRVGNLEFSEEVSARILTGSALGLALVIGLLLALPHDDWMAVELVRNGQPFGETDPYFRLDLGTWMYHMPLEASVHLWAMIALVAMTVLVVFLYALTPSLRWDQGRLYVSGYVRRHLFALAVVLLLLLAWGYRLDAFGLLHEGTGPLGSISAIDHRVGIPSNLALALIAVAAAMLVAWAGWFGHVRVAFFTITVMLLSTLTVRQLVPAVAGRFVTAEDVEAKEQSYRGIRNAYTRRAYGVDEVDQVPAADDRTTAADVLRGASLWDGEALRRQIASSRRAARTNGDMGWEAQGGRLVALSVEQPLGPAATGGEPAWGLVRVAADVTDDRGDPAPRDHPELLDGQTLRGVLISDSATSYYVLSDTSSDIVGRQLVSLADRVAHAWHLQNPSLLRRRPGDPPLRVVLRRDVRDRVGTLYPFFSQGTRVVPLVWRDSLFWAVHLYAASDWYPLSSPYQLGGAEVRYLHHAGVALVNARSGRTTALPSPRAGPMAASWISRFPELFADAAMLDPELLAAIPPPVDAAWIVAQAMAQAGLRGEFDARGHLPSQPMDSLFVRASTPPFVDRVSGTLGIAVPVLEATEDVRGLVITTGGANATIRWERSPMPPRFSRLVAELHHATDSLRNDLRGTRPLAGSVRMLPSENGPVAIQSLYVVRPDGTMPVLVTALWRNGRVAVGRTLIEAAGLPEPTVSDEPLTPERFRRRVAELYESMREAMRRGDWSGIGAAYEALGRLLRSPRQP